MSWNIPLLLLFLESIYSIYHGQIGKVAVSRNYVIWIKGDMFTYLNTPTGHATAVKQATICSPTHIVTSQHIIIATIQRRILLYMTHTTKPDITTCSHCCQSSGWMSVKTTATYHLLRSWPDNPLTLRLSHILTGWGTTSQLLGLDINSLDTHTWSHAWP